MTVQPRLCSVPTPRLESKVEERCESTRGQFQCSQPKGHDGKHYWTPGAIA